MSIDVTTQRKSKKMYTGVMTFELVGLNPDTDELSDILGLDIEREPSYVDTDREGTPRIRLDFWFKNEQYGIVKNFPVWLTDSVVNPSAKGKTQFMGVNGLSTYATDVAELAGPKFNKWIFPDTRDGVVDFRPAHVGEADLYAMLIALYKSDTRNPNNTIVVDTDWSDFVAGDISELSGLRTDGTMKVQLLVAQLPKELDDGNTVWNVDFYRKVVLSEGDSPRRMTTLLKKDVENGYPYKGNYQDTLAVEEFDPTQAVPSQTTQPASQADVRGALNI